MARSNSAQMVRQATRNTSSFDPQAHARLRVAAGSLDPRRVFELLCQTLEAQAVSLRVYNAAIHCAQHDDLRDLWKTSLDQTRDQERILGSVLAIFDIDTEAQAAMRGLVDAYGDSYVNAIDAATDGPRDAAQFVAAECVVFVETKNHVNWELIGEICQTMNGEGSKALQQAICEASRQVDERLHGARAWTYRLWLESLGLDTSPPPVGNASITSSQGRQ